MLVVKSCVELLRSCGINIRVVFSNIPAFCLDHKLPTTKNNRTRKIGGLYGRVEFKELFVVYRKPGKDHTLEGSNCAVKTSCSEWKSRGILAL